MKSKDISRKELIKLIFELRQYAIDLQSTLTECHAKYYDEIEECLSRCEFEIDEED